MAYLKAPARQYDKWKVVVIDNASADETAAIARQCSGDAPHPIHVVREHRLEVCALLDNAPLNKRNMISSALSTTTTGSQLTSRVLKNTK
jgi:glycosyltransferase involved in cell wall biosynthesis